MRIKPFKLNQIADEIKKYFRQTGKLFEDEEFSHKNQSTLNLAVEAEELNEKEALQEK